MSRVAFALFAVAFVTVIAAPSKDEKRGFWSAAAGVVGSATGALGNALYPKETQRINCQKSGFIDDDQRVPEGTEQHEIFNAFAGALHDMQTMVAPTEAVRAGCITAGVYHPDRPQRPQINNILTYPQYPTYQTVAY